jgi:small subunit ribosomal protein S17
MADETNEQGTSADAEVPTEEQEVTEPEAEETDAAAAEVEEPVAEAEPAEEPAAEEPAAEAEGTSADAEVLDEEHAAPEEPAAEGEAPAPEDESAAGESSEPGTSAVAEVPRKRKRKRLPRALRPQRSKPKREKPKERRPIARLPKPEHVRGRRQERQGTVVSASTDKTIVVRVDTVKVHPRYKKVIRRSTKLHAHDESNQAKLGDIVRIVETRPISKLKRWRLREVVQEAK